MSFFLSFFSSRDLLSDVFNNPSKKKRKKTKKKKNLFSPPRMLADAYAALNDRIHSILETENDGFTAMLNPP